MKRLGLVILFLLLLLPPVTAVNVWEHINTSREMYFINVHGSFTEKLPLDPLNDSRIAFADIGYVHNDTHYLSVYFDCTYASCNIYDDCAHPSRCGWWEGFFLKHGNPTPFNFSIWNVTKVMEEYHWGLENYLPQFSWNQTPECDMKTLRPKGYWLKGVTGWNVVINSQTFRITLYRDYTGAVEWVTFKCHNSENPTCEWEGPTCELRGDYIMPPTTTTTTKQEEKTCGPALLVGLVLVPLLVKQGKR